MTFEDVRKFMLQRLAEVTTHFPNGRAVPYRRIGVRQQQLYALAAHENHEYAGTSAVATLTNGAADLSDIANPVLLPELITRVEVKTLDALADPETLGFDVGAEVTIVPIDDPDGVAPRATLRNRVIRGVDGELDMVDEIEVFYPYRPDPADADEDGARVIEIPDPHSELLVIDLTREQAKKLTNITKEDRAAFVAALNEEEGPFLEAWLQHARDYAPVRSRFARPPFAPKGRRA